MIELFLAGVLALKSYVATHVLTCLVPAFFLAGAMVTFINKEAVIDHLGESSNKLKSFSLASISSFFIAACSCTVIPVASGLYFAGAGVGVAFIILWVAPSANLLSLIYTNNILGTEIVVARVIASLLMAFVVGYIMTLIFGHEHPVEAATFSGESHGKLMKRSSVVLLTLLALSLLLPNYLVQNAAYIYKVLVFSGSAVVIGIYALINFSRQEILDWMRETWWFVRTILPYLILGVFLVGVIGKLLPETWVQQWLGGNGLQASFLATMIGAFSYFATMTEAPFVDTLLKLGMGKGPALALLLTGPGLSLPNWLAIAKVFGIKKALVYVPSIVVLGTLVGWFFGNFVF